MTITHIPAKHFSPMKWSGGLTTELFIYPKDAHYAKRDFEFRLSTATVEIQESIFTPLPTIARTLLVLDGEMKLDHKHHHTTVLCAGNIDRFDGGWETSSIGKCVDFNLMTMGTTIGGLSILNFAPEQEVIQPLKESSNWLFLFLNTGHLDVFLENENHTLRGGDLLVISDPTNTTLRIVGNAISQLVFCTIDR